MDFWSSVSMTFGAQFRNSALRAVTKAWINALLCNSEIKSQNGIFISIVKFSNNVKVTNKYSNPKN